MAGKIKNIKDVIFNFNVKHNYKFDYSKFEYNGINIKSIIICPLHGEFLQNSKLHLHRGCGCPKCKDIKSLNTFILKGSEKNNNNRKKTFITSCKKLHPHLNFDKTLYKNKKTKVIVTCKKHGDYETTPRLLLDGSICRKCFEEKAEHWTLQGWINNSKNNKSFLYIIQMESENEKFIKCGITNVSVENRKSKLPSFYKKTIVFELESSPEFCYILEKDIKKIFSNYKIIPLIDFGGKYECFTFLSLNEIITYINQKINLK